MSSALRIFNSSDARALDTPCPSSVRRHKPTGTATEEVVVSQGVFTKGEHEAAYSGFQGHSGETGLADWLRAHEVSTVDIVGIATDHCVRATALDAAKAGFATTVLLDLTAGVARSTVDSALEQLRGAGVELIGEPVVRNP